MAKKIKFSMNMRLFFVIVFNLLIPIVLAAVGYGFAAVIVLSIQCLLYAFLRLSNRRFRIFSGRSAVFDAVFLVFLSLGLAVFAILTFWFPDSSLLQI